MNDPGEPSPDSQKQPDPFDPETMVREHGGYLLSVVRRFLRNEDDARDCVQETFIQAIRKIDSFERRSSLRTWLHRIAVNQALMTLRRRKRKAEESIDDLLPDFDGNGCRIEPSWRFDEPLDVVMERAEVRDLVRQAILQLPETYRIVLMLRDIEGYDTAEVAALLDTNVGVIKTRLHRARAALKRLLAPVMTREGTWSSPPPGIASSRR